MHPALDTTWIQILLLSMAREKFNRIYLYLVPVTNITALQLFAANQSLTLKPVTAARTNSFLIERNLEQDRVIEEGFPADG